MRDSGIKNIYFLFTTGRTGTALLSQCFGLEGWEKQAYRVNGHCVVTHEPWQDVPVDKMKLVDIYSKEAFDIASLYLEDKLSEVKEAFPDVDSLFITDHKIGRYFGPYIAKSDLSFKVVYVERDCVGVSHSFERKRLMKKEELDEPRYERYLRRMWSHNKYHPSDFSIINKVSELAWSEYSFESKFLWYAEETALQWAKLKSTLSQENFLEIKLDKIYTKKDLDNISEFLNLGYDEVLFSLRAN